VNPQVKNFLFQLTPACAELGETELLNLFDLHRLGSERAVASEKFGADGQLVSGKS
jgi:hypothetical protein